MDFSQYLLHELYDTHENQYICSCGMKLNKFDSGLSEEELAGVVKFLASKYCMESYFDGYIKNLILADLSTGLRIVAICFKGYGMNPPDIVKTRLENISQKISDIVGIRIGLKDEQEDCFYFKKR